MTFKRFLNESIRDIREKEIIDLRRSKGLIAENYDDRNITLWIAHKNIESNKNMVRATWFLAIATIILSGLTLYFQYSK